MCGGRDTRMTKRFDTLLAACFLVFFLVLSCDRVEEKSLSGVAPIESANIQTFSMVAWLSTPRQQVRIHVAKASAVGQLIDLRVFGGFQIEMTDVTVAEQFGKPVQTRTDAFGGTWAMWKSDAIVGRRRHKTTRGTNRYHAVGLSKPTRTGFQKKYFARLFSTYLVPRNR